MRGRTNVMQRKEPTINGDIKEFVVANDNIIEKGDFVQYILSEQHEIIIDGEVNLISLYNDYFNNKFFYSNSNGNILYCMEMKESKLEVLELISVSSDNGRFCYYNGVFYFKNNDKSSFKLSRVKFEKGTFTRLSDILFSSPIDYSVGVNSNLVIKNIYVNFDYLIIFFGDAYTGTRTGRTKISAWEFSNNFQELIYLDTLEINYHTLSNYSIKNNSVITEINGNFVICFLNTYYTPVFITFEIVNQSINKLGSMEFNLYLSSDLNEGFVVNCGTYFITGFKADKFQLRFYKYTSYDAINLLLIEDIYESYNISADAKESFFISNFYNDYIIVYATQYLSSAAKDEYFIVYKLDELSTVVKEKSNILRYQNYNPDIRNYLISFNCIKNGLKYYIFGVMGNEGGYVKSFEMDEDLLVGSPTNYVKLYNDGKALGFAKTGGASGDIIQVYVPKEV